MFYYYERNNWKIYMVKEVDSTMDEIKKDIYSSNSNTLLMAFKQNKGRGRKSNKWVSDLGNLFLSIKLCNFKRSKALIFNYLIGIIVYDTISFFLKKKNDIYIKWPNDILIGNKKIAGILIDIITSGNELSNLYLGIGINTKFASLAKEYKTTSLWAEGAKDIPRKKILKKLTYYFNYWETVLKNKSPAFIIENWMNRSFPINSIISFKNNNNKIKGVYRGINIDGSINISVKGKESKFYSLETLA